MIAPGDPETCGPSQSQTHEGEGPLAWPVFTGVGIPDGMKQENKLSAKARVHLSVGFDNGFHVTSR